MTRRTPPFRRGGRPRKTDSEKRKLLISARVRQDELATIEGRAAEHNIPLSDFLREQALSGAILVRRSRTLSAIDRHDRPDRLEPQPDRPGLQHDRRHIPRAQHRGDSGRVARPAQTYGHARAGLQ